jgi:3-oxoadipate enol-lactonase
MPEITVNGINLYYEVYGDGEPLIFLHGFAVDHLVFSAMPEAYQSYYQVILLDNRGSGQSDCPSEPYSIEVMAEDIAEFCRVLGLGPAHFVGHSMGGMILQQLAHRYPKQVRSAVFCNTDVAIDIRYALAAKARLAFIEAKCPLRELIESGMGWTFSTDFLERPGMVEQIINLRMANPFPITPMGYRNQLNALLNFNSSDWVGKIKAPSLVIGADQDIIIFESRIRRLAKSIPNAQYKKITASGHAPFIEQPDAFHALVKKFLKSNT